MSETGFYVMGGFGIESSRAAAVARWIPDSVAYVYGRSSVRTLFEHHGVTTEVPKCGSPGCTGLSPLDLERWIRARNPERLVMDAHPYGVLNNELRSYISRRTAPTHYLKRRTTTPITHDTTHFDSITDADDPAFPILPFEDHELPTRAESRSLLGADDRPVVLVVGEGTTPDITTFVKRRCQARGLEATVVTTYPVMPLMVGADLVVGYAGYAQNQALAVGVPMHAITSSADNSQSWRENTTPTLLGAAIDALEVRDAPETVTYANYARRAAARVAGDPNWAAVNG